MPWCNPKLQPRCRVVLIYNQAGFKFRQQLVNTEEGCILHSAGMTRHDLSDRVLGISAHMVGLVTAVFVCRPRHHNPSDGILWLFTLLTTTTVLSFGCDFLIRRCVTVTVGTHASTHSHTHQRICFSKFHELPGFEVFARDW